MLITMDILTEPIILLVSVENLTELYTQGVCVSNLTTGEAVNNWAHDQNNKLLYVITREIKNEEAVTKAIHKNIPQKVHGGEYYVTNI